MVRMRSPVRIRVSAFQIKTASVKNGSRLYLKKADPHTKRAGPVKKPGRALFLRVKSNNCGKFPFASGRQWLSRQNSCSQACGTPTEFPGSKRSFPQSRGLLFDRNGELIGNLRAAVHTHMSTPHAPNRHNAHFTRLPHFAFSFRHVLPTVQVGCIISLPTMS